DDDAKLISHNAISSAASLERVSITGDLDRRQRIRLAIVPQKGAIRLGGYYEIEVAGAAELAGSPGASANRAPQSTALGHPGAKLVEPGTSLAQPGTRLVQPGMTPVQPGTTPVEPGTTLVQPGTRLVQPGTTPVQPGATLVEPGTTLVQPGTRLVQPG